MMMNDSGGPSGPSILNAKGLCLLSLDGGGVRGLSTLYILRDIMAQLSHERDDRPLLKPCDVFDLIGGTSTGGCVEVPMSNLPTLTLSLEWLLGSLQ